MKNNKFKLFLTLFLDYFKIGLFTFGGGLSMISLIEKTFVEKRGFITRDELLDIVAIAEATPGVIAINCATYIGYKMLKVVGSIICTLAVALPSFLIILLISFFYEKFIEIEIIRYLITGLMVGVTFLLFRSAIKIYKNFKKDFISYLLIIASFILVLLNKFIGLNVSTIYIVLGGGLISFIFYLLTFKKRRGEKK